MTLKLIILYIYLLFYLDSFYAGSSLKNSFNTLNAAAAKLKSITHSKFDAAVNTGDVASVERFFKLFPLLGIKEEGLTKFAKWQSAQVIQIYHILTNISYTYILLP